MSSPVPHSFRRRFVGVWLLLVAGGLLFTGLAAAQAKRRGGGIGANGPKPGSAAPDFTLKTVGGQTVKASELWAQKPLVLMTGSHTCPVFRGKTAAFEALAREFGQRAHFRIIYTIEAHPQGDPSPYNGKEWVTPQNERAGILFRQPATQEERLSRARACIAAEKLTTPLLVDGMANAVWKAYGSAPNCAYVIGKDGKISEAQPWMDPPRLRQAVERAVTAR